MTTSSPQDARNLTLSQAIHTILDRRGIGPRQHRAVLEAALGMQYQQVRRRMTGEKTWSVGELARLAAHFGESPFELIAILIDEQGQSATFQVAGSSLPCTVWPGERLSKGGLRGPLVAVSSESTGSWIVTTAADAGARPAHAIKRLIVEEAKRSRVAVVDADVVWAEKVMEFLRRKGLECVGFDSFEHARAAVDTGQYDGFIMDWSLEPEQAEAMLRAVRSKTHGPILLVSGSRGEDTVQLDRLALVLAEHGAQFYEKPVSAFSLYSALELGLKMAERSANK